MREHSARRKQTSWGKGMFVGDDRHQTIATLLEWFDQVRGGSGPRLLCAVGDPGIGKTRVVTELYRALARERQPGVPYWPAELASASADQQSRKVIAPVAPFTIPSGAEPSWFWWGISCQRDQAGVPFNALQLAGAQFDVHARYAAERAQARDARWERRAAALAGCIEMLGYANPVPELATVASGALRRFARRRRHRAEVEAGRLVDYESAGVDEAMDLASRVIALSSGDGAIPVVIAVDDLHWADGVTLRFLDRLLRQPDAGVLVLATAWTHQLVAGSPTALAGPISGVGSWIVEQESAGRAVRWNVAPLAAQDLGTLVRARAPRTPDETVDALVDLADGNALALELYLELPVVRRDAEGDGSIDLDADQVRALPRGIDAVYRQLFDELTPFQQVGLSLAALQGQVFLESGLGAAAAATAVFDAARVLTSSGIAGWVERIGSDTWAFTQVGRRQVAEDALAEQLTDRMIEDATQASLDAIEARRAAADWPTRSTEVRISLLRAAIQMAEAMSAGGSGIADLARELVELLPEDCQAERVELRRRVIEMGDEQDPRRREDVVDLLDEVAASDEPTVALDHLDLLEELVPQTGEELEALASVQDAAAAALDEAVTDVGPAAFSAWDPSPVGDLRAMSSGDLAQVIAEIVGVEGPTATVRLERLLVAASITAQRASSGTRAALKRAIRRGISSGLLVRIPGTIEAVRCPEQPDVVLREMGTRQPDEITDAELLAFARTKTGEVGSFDELQRAVAQYLGLSRRSAKLIARLDRALAPLANGPFRAEAESIVRDRAEGGDSLDDLYDLTERLGLDELLANLVAFGKWIDAPVRATRGALAWRSPADGRRTLLRVAFLGENRVAVGYDAANVAALLGRPVEEVEQLLGENWAEGDDAVAYTLVGLLVREIYASWERRLPETPWLVLLSVIDSSDSLDLEEVDFRGNFIWWFATDESSASSYEELLDAFREDPVEGYSVLFQRLIFDDELHSGSLVDFEVLGDGNDHRDEFRRQLRENPVRLLLPLWPDEPEDPSDALEG